MASRCFGGGPFGAHMGLVCNLDGWWLDRGTGPAPALPRDGHRFVRRRSLSDWLLEPLLPTCEDAQNFVQHLASSHASPRVSLSPSYKYSMEALILP